MTELKPGWQRVKFGDVVRLNKETSKDPAAEGIERVIGLEHLEPGDLRIRSWGDLADGTTFTKRVRPGQVLFGKRRAYQRKVAVADFDAVCSGDIYVLESADRNELLPELLPFICQTEPFHAHAVGTSAGSLSPRTNWQSLAGFEFLLAPPNEQGLQLKTLQATWTYVQFAINAANAASALEQSLLAEAFPSSARDKRPTVPLAEVAKIRLGYKVSPVHKGDRVTKKIITVAQLQEGAIDANSAKEVTIPLAMVDRYRPSIGDLLVTEGGNLDQLGRGAIWRGELDDCVIQNHVFSISPKAGKVRAEFLEGLMRSPRGREFFLRYAKRTSNLASIDQGKVQAMLVPLVSYEDQCRWSEFYVRVKASREIAQARARAASSLLRVLSSQLLSG
jgi:type I restriction enzyme S subunit